MQTTLAYPQEVVPNPILGYLLFFGHRCLQPVRGNICKSGGIRKGYRSSHYSPRFYGRWKPILTSLDFPLRPCGHPRTFCHPHTITQPTIVQSQQSASSNQPAPVPTPVNNGAQPPRKGVHRALMVGMIPTTTAGTSTAMARGRKPKLRVVLRSTSSAWTPIAPIRRLRRRLGQTLSVRPTTVPTRTVVGRARERV